MSDIMIDLETLSTRNDAVILTIGAVKFNINKELDKTKQLYMRINLQSCKNLKMHTDRSTVKWWKEQSKEAQYEAMDFALYCEAAINKIERDGSKTT